MSARKLGRFFGLVFVLAALTGGTAVSVSAEHATGGPAAISVQVQDGDIDWG
ncbi:hypothetical protein Asp14428_38790 [Actinoplanes sp. NBRC 14428]|uniref:Uncharacterized protein n=1 Tax=Pseudosporangium ferrugineum TaxID=439699 RepID=A0A2T0RH12_9ACTN|nr:hypothetical protein [Pseudosporangium ferrugineum]PRY20390.1 hypothetical protein CLV70_124106 [Pseudosporangium ferrugineum]BCJ52404.1 hypothetical protein Asp14428_38790 [Actinoplanes sp. NBRC 14428]